MDNRIGGIRERARQRGGEEYVAKLDKGLAKERELTEILDAKLAETKALPTENHDRLFALAGMTEALGLAYAKSIVTFAAEQGRTTDSELIALALTAISSAVAGAITDRKTEASGVLDKIMAAASKGDRQ